LHERPDGRFTLARADPVGHRAAAGLKPAVLYRFGQHQRGDPYRANVLDLQTAADPVVRATRATAGQRVIDIPPNMTTSGRVQWIAARLTRLGITRNLPQDR